MQGTKFVASQTGTYSFCVDNRMARWTAKVLTFDLEITPPEKRKEQENHDVFSAAAGPAAGEATTAVAVDVMKTTANRLHSKLLTIENSQYYHYHREKRHRETAESTNVRVRNWSVAETLLCIAASAMQIFIIQHWFASTLRTLPTSRV